MGPDIQISPCEGPPAHITHEALFSLSLSFPPQKRAMSRGGPSNPVARVVYDSIFLLVIPVSLFILKVRKTCCEYSSVQRLSCMDDEGIG